MTLPLYAVIMAGGSGSRLWPLSRQNHPKQLLDLTGNGRSLFQEAIDRLLPLLPAERILVVTTSDLAPKLHAQSPDIPVANFVIEPEGRGTAPVIALGALYAEHLAGQPVVIACLTADHFIQNRLRFRRALEIAHRRANQGQIVTLGIRPNLPHTGYGYIELGEQIGEEDDFTIHKVTAFKEKPHLELAEQFVASGRYTWNSGMFIWRTDRVQHEFERQLPETARLLDEIRAVLGTPQAQVEINRIWPTVPKQTIDYGIMENARDITTIPCDFGWSDVGSWDSLFNVVTAGAYGNIRLGNGQHLSVDSAKTLVYSETGRIIATIGLNDMVIVDTPDALLICPTARAQEVRTVVETLKARDATRHYL